ncbi:MAG: glycosyltransferase family 2 protein [Acidobacteria bacterium]|nr:glycosyltransferase family 2 protein [Acidobacteriota bacterium]
MLTLLMFYQLIIAQIVFIASLVFIVFVYFGYPVFVYALSKLFAWPVRQADITPSVSFIIAAYNEENDLAAKIENTLSLDYPSERMEIIVASDCSTDRTDEIARSYAERGVVLYRQKSRLGKTVAQSRAVKVSTGDILIFSDATTIYEHDAIRQIVRSFADPEVGCVAGQLVYLDRTSSAVGKGCRSYWGYEKFLKKCESQLSSLIGVSGCLYAVRRSCHARLAHDMIDDFVVATEIHLQGLRTVYEPGAISLEATNQRSRDEFRMRVRVIEQTMNALSRYREILNPFRHGMFAIQMLCHKLLRYTVPFWLLTAFIANAALVRYSEFYLLSFIGQITFYGIALVGLLADRSKLSLGPLTFAYYFTLVNAASLLGFLKFIRGENHVVWEPMRERREPLPAHKG